MWRAASLTDPAFDLRAEVAEVQKAIDELRRRMGRGGVRGSVCSLCGPHFVGKCPHLPARARCSP